MKRKKIEEGVTKRMEKIKKKNSRKREKKNVVEIRKLK